MRSIIATITVLWLSAAALQASEGALRVAVIGGMSMSGMWQKVAEAFEAHSGIAVETVVTGPKDELDGYCRAHPVDLVTMHSSDTMADLAGDGLFERLTPWARNAQMIVGSRSNPARIAPEDSLEQALQKIAASGAPFLIHASGGTFEVFGNLASTYGFEPSVRFTTAKRGFLHGVARDGGYTLYGVIPFLMQKQHHEEIAGYFIDDPALRRPYLAAIGSSHRIGAERHRNAEKLLAFLTSETAQNIITTFRIGGFEKTPVFFPVKP